MSDSDGEYKVTDTQGRFAVAVREGRKVSDVSWTPGRVLLSNRRLILAGNDGKRTIPSRSFGGWGRHDANQSVARVSNYVSFDLGDQVLIVAASDHEAFERDVYRALLDQRTVTAKHPAIEGGVVQETEWEQARVKIDENGLNAALESGAFVKFRPRRHQRTRRRETHRQRREEARDRGVTHRRRGDEHRDPHRRRPQPDAVRRGVAPERRRAQFDER